MEVLNSEVLVRKSVLRDGSHVFREHFCQLLSNDTSHTNIRDVVSDLQPVLAVAIAAHRNAINLAENAVLVHWLDFLFNAHI